MWFPGPSSFDPERSCQLGELFIIAGHDLRGSALLFELYTQPVLHSDNMLGVWIAYNGVTMGIQQRMYSHGNLLANLWNNDAKTNGFWILDDFLCPVLGQTNLPIHQLPYIRCHVDSDARLWGWIIWGWWWSLVHLIPETWIAIYHDEWWLINGDSSLFDWRWWLTVIWWFYQAHELW